MKFLAHNVLLDNGETTKRHTNLLADTPAMTAIRGAIYKYLPTAQTDAAKLRAVDLGCMEGGYSVELARMGFETLGIDARKENLVKASYIKLNTALPNLKFVLDDVRSLERYGTFDVTLCFGIVYHLDNPASFFQTLYKQTNELLIIHTYYAPGPSVSYRLRSFLYHTKVFFTGKPTKAQQNKELGLTADKLEKGLSFIQHIKSYRLGRLTTHEGYRGRWYDEWDEKTSKSDVEKMPSASYNNPKSFWFCKTELIRALYDAGFVAVHEVMDPIGNFASENPSEYYERGMFVVLKNNL